MRSAQKLEPLTLDELTAIANQLQDAAKVCFSAIETMQAKNAKELHVLYRTSIVNGLSAVNRTRESVYEAWRFLEMGSKVKISPRSVARKAMRENVKKESEQTSAGRKKKS